MFRGVALTACAHRRHAFPGGVTPSYGCAVPHIAARGYTISLAAGALLRSSDVTS